METSGRELEPTEPGYLRRVDRPDGGLSLGPSPSTARRVLAQPSASPPRIVAVHAVELGGRVAAEVLLGVGRLLRVLAQVALPLPAPPLAAGPLPLPLGLTQITLG